VNLQMFDSMTDKVNIENEIAKLLQQKSKLTGAKNKKKRAKLNKKIVALEQKALEDFSKDSRTIKRLMKNCLKRPSHEVFADIMKFAIDLNQSKANSGVEWNASDRYSLERMLPFKNSPVTQEFLQARFLFDLGMEHWINGDREKCVDLLGQVLALGKDEVMIFRSLPLVVNLATLAKEMYEKNPENSNHFLVYIQALKVGRLRSDQELCEEIIEEINSNKYLHANPQIFHTAALMLQFNEQYVSAAEMASLHIKLYPEDGDGYFVRAASYRIVGQYKKSMADYIKALKYFHDDARHVVDCYYNMSYVLAMQRKVISAKEYYIKGLKIEENRFPFFPPAYKNIKNAVKLTIGPANLAEFQCAHCGREKMGLPKCSRCEKVRYCNETCLRNHWKKHKKVCKPVPSKVSGSKV